MALHFQSIKNSDLSDDFKQEVKGLPVGAIEELPAFSRIPELRLLLLKELGFEEIRFDRLVKDLERRIDPRTLKDHLFPVPEEQQ